MNVLRMATALGVVKLTLAKLTLRSWVLLLVLFSLLVFAIIVAYLGWTSASGTDVPASGYVAMAIGVVFSLLVGFGLMGLLFYSSRHGYDEPPKPADDETNSGV